MTEKSIISNYDVVLLAIDTYQNPHILTSLSHSIIILYTNKVTNLELGYRYNVFRCIRCSTLHYHINTLINDILQEVETNYFSFQCNRISYLYKINEIDYIVTKGNYTYIYIFNKHFKVRTNTNIHQIEEKYSHFISVDKGTIVNIRKIKSINANNLKLTLHNGISIHCSKRGIRDIKNYIKQRINDKNE